MNEYKYFSYFYDDVFSEVKYKDWLDFLLPYLTPSSKILDLACGSGTLAILLKLKGYDVEGLDLSQTILDIAKEKAKMHHLSIPFHLEDMTDFKLDKTFDVITCFFDSVNFLKDKEAIDSLFSSVYNHLALNGLFIFDIFSLSMLQSYKHNKVKYKLPTHCLTWKTKLAQKDTLMHTIHIRDGKEKYVETYYEYYHDISCFENPKFQLERICGDFKESLEKKDMRILFILKKKL